MYTRHWITLGLVLALSLPTMAAAQEASEAELATRIANTIRDSGQLKNFRLGVVFEEGEAVLLGEVADQAQAKAAMRIAEKVAGVKSVKSELKYNQASKLRVEPGQPNLSATPSEDSGLLLSLASHERKTVAAKPVSKPSKRTMAKKLGKPTETLQPQQVALAPQPPLPPEPQHIASAPRQRFAPQPQRVARTNNNLPRPVAYTHGGQRPVPAQGPVRPVGYGGAGARPAGFNPGGGGATGAGYTSPNLPGYAWPSYAASQNYSALTYPRQYSPTAWPYIGPFYPYPQVPLGWRKVALEWDDGWWFLDFSHHQSH